MISVLKILGAGLCHRREFLYAFTPSRSATQNQVVLCLASYSMSCVKILLMQVWRKDFINASPFQKEKKSSCITESALFSSLSSLAASMPHFLVHSLHFLPASVYDYCCQSCLSHFCITKLGRSGSEDFSANQASQRQANQYSERHLSQS